jgi:hypothetical protein
MSGSTTCNKQKAAAEANKIKLIKLATEFYSLPIEKAREYVTIPHRLENSAVCHLITEYEEGDNVQGGKGMFVTYECQYCTKKYHMIRAFEEHC